MFTFLENPRANLTTIVNLSLLDSIYHDPKSQSSPFDNNPSSFVNMTWNIHQYLGFNYACWVVCAFGFAARVFANIKGLRKTPWYREVLVFLALASFGVYAAIDHRLYFDHWFDIYTDAFSSRPLKEIEYTFLISYVVDYFYFPTIYYCKIDLLFLYHQLAPRAHHPKIFRVLCITWFVVISCFIIQLCFTIFGCFPIKKHWDITPPEWMLDSCSNSDEAFIAVWVTHLFSDLWVYAVPIWIIWRVQMMSSKQKWSAASMFLIGFINIFAALFLLINQLVVADVDWTWEANGANLFLTTLQIATAVFLVCMPQIKSVWRCLVEKARKVQTSRAEASASESDKKSSQTSDENGSSTIQLSPMHTPPQVRKPELVASVDNV